MWRILVAISLLLTIGMATSMPAPLGRASAPLQIQGQLSACGADAPDGLILHQAFGPDGTPAVPPLALHNPATGASRPIDVPEPTEWFSAQYGCSAFVRTATGAYYLVLGRTGEAFPLEFMDPADEWKYNELTHWRMVGERRFAYSETPGYMGNKALIMDLERGVYSDLTPLITEKGSLLGAHFSPTGRYLEFDAGPVLNERTWLIPTDDPGQARQLSFPVGSSVREFDETEERVLFWNISGDMQRLFIEEIATGETYLVATDPQETYEYDPYLTGWFVPGQDDLIAVLHHDRFALVDISGPEAVERFVIEGHRPFSTFEVAPSGTAGVLDMKPETIFVDLETGESRVITTEDGTALSSVESHGRWGFARIGTVDGPTFGYGLVDLETGDFRPIHMLAEGESNDFRATAWSADGRILLFTVIDADQQRHLRLIDNELETDLPIADAEGIAVTLSPDAEWAAFSTTKQTDSGPVSEMILLETATGAETSLGPGLNPVWLGP